MTQPPLDPLQRRPAPEVAAALRAAKPQILSRWRGEVTRVLPGADELTRRQLDNSIPDLLEKIAQALDAGVPGPTQRLIAASPAHGAARFDQDFNLDELLVEYAILRRIVVEEIVPQLARPLDLVESIELNQAIDIVEREAAVAFAEFQATEMRADANAMTKYLSFLSHDIRGGLNGVMLMIEVLRRDIGAEPRFQESVSDLDTMRRLMLDTVATMDRFLNAEKLRRGKMPVKVETVWLNKILDAVARSLAYQSKERELEIRVDADPSLAAQTDRELLTMILQNLVSNAVKYSERGDVLLLAQCPNSDQVSCRISVVDRGPGIAESQLANLFAPFTRGETYGQKGVGLGLWIARHAGELIGAKLWAESKLGHGSTFHVDLPKNPTAAG